MKIGGKKVVNVIYGDPEGLTANITRVTLKCF